MAIGRFRLTNPTLALFYEGGHHVAHTLPSGTIIIVDKIAFDGEKLVNVTWDGKIVMMFAEDLRARAEQVKGTSTYAGSWILEQLDYSVLKRD